MNKLTIKMLALAAMLFGGASILKAASPNTAADVASPVLRIEPAFESDHPVAPPDVPPAFLLKLVLNPKANIRDRLEAVREMGENTVQPGGKGLSRGETEDVLIFLKNHPDAREVNLAGLRNLKNNLINVLKVQSLPPAGLTETLIDMFHDLNQDFVTRDYAVQHLATWYARGAGDSPDAKERIRVTLKEAMQENSSISGTALLGMHRLSAIDHTINGTDIDRSAVHMATASDTPSAARITAIEVCAERRLLEALPAIEACAQAEGQIGLQISAIGALGEFGRAQDGALLQRLAREGNDALRPATAAALKGLSRTAAARDSLKSGTL